MNSQPRVLTIAIQYPGLGDQLFWSHIPRIAKDKATFCLSNSVRREEFLQSLLYNEDKYDIPILTLH